MILSFVVGDIEIASQKIGVGWLGFTSQADARVGRPLTPVSVAGVGRRTTRRVIRRGAAIGVIPAGCPLGSYYGYSLYYCGGTYYQRSGGGYVVVYF
jgi:hypothetical protein